MPLEQLRSKFEVDRLKNSGGCRVGPGATALTLSCPFVSLVEDVVETGVRGKHDALLKLITWPGLHEAWRTMSPSNQRAYLDGQRAQDGRAALHLAAENGLAALVEAILAARASVDLPDCERRTALMLAAAKGDAPIVSLLLKAGASPSAADAAGAQPLHYAARADGKAVVELLVEAGAELNASDCRGRTPVAISAVLQKATTVEALLALGASPLSFDRLGEMPLGRSHGSRREAVARGAKPGAAAAAPCSVVALLRASQRWDSLGGTEASQHLLREERRLRRLPDGDNRCDIDRRRAGLPPLC